MHRQLIPAILLALTAAGCAGRYASDRDTLPALPDSVYIEAFNENFFDARVHAVYAGGQRRSLGTVPGNGGHVRTTLVWEPRALLFEVSFIIDGTSYVSYPLDVARGESIEVRLPPNIDESGFFRRLKRS